MRNTAAVALFAALVALAVAPAAQAGGGPVVTQRILSGLDTPVYAASPPGDPRLFIVLLGGQVVIWDGGQLLPTPFLDIRSKVNTDGEGGLLGIAFPPDYATSRAFYVYYTADGPNAGTPLRSRISRFSASSVDPNVAEPMPSAANEKILLIVDQPFTNHNGGTVAFGPDGYLYMGFGDGGDAGDPGDRAQDGSELLGKMLRLDVSFTNFTDDYAIPSDNPFVGPDGIRDEIWAIGMRNPFRYSFDRLTGDLYIGDVGQGDWEEIDVEPAGSGGGRNYGWDVMEGTACYDPSPGEPACNDPSLTLPIYEYDHYNPNCNAVTGGVVYRGGLPSLYGQYLFADECDGNVWSIVWDGAGGTTGPEVRRDDTDLLPDVGSIDRPVAFAEDGFGTVFVVDLDGEVFQVPEPGQALLLATGAALLALRARTRRGAGAPR